MRFNHSSNLMVRFFRVIMLATIFTTPAAAQLSPGELSKPHIALEGMDKCVSCHELGKGPSDRRCLDCHTEIDERLNSRRGYHHRLMQDRGNACPKCHSDHNGRDYELIHWPEGQDRFDHALTGFQFEGAHTTLKCRQCHQPKYITRDLRALRPDVDLDRTFLGLGTRCLDCHVDRHQGQLKNDCTRCHDQQQWKPARMFDHELAGYRLTGLHRQTACEKCHPPMPGAEEDGQPVIRYTGISFGACTDCHRDETHQGRLGTRCEECHQTTGWRQPVGRERFDHSTTVYPLEGRHSAVECRKCHNGPKYTTPLPHGACADCHQDAHQGQFAKRPDGGRCESCHDLNGFIPTRFDLAEHQQSPYPLTGSHTAVPCGDCHRLDLLQGDEPIRRFRMADSACHECHKDEHRGQFPPRLGEPWCDTCHNTSSWKEVKIDHSLTRFPLEASHGRVACAKCHPQEDKGTDSEYTLYKPLELVCIGCHADIHQGQFAVGESPKDCNTCHTPDTWKTISFEHDRDARFSLKGAHERVPCSSCHSRENAGGEGDEFIRYRPLESDCVDCHRGGVQSEDFN
jgi:hypothetical protein